MKNKTRIMIVDDQAISRHFFEMAAEHSGRYEVAFSVTSAFAAQVYLLKGKVDLVVMDILMNDGSNGLDAAQQILEHYPEIKIIAITSMPDPSWMRRAREIGVHSFWYKEADDVSILDLLDRTMAGESVYPAFAPPAKLGNAMREDFTARELDVLRELATGKTNGDIAKTLGVSENTVKYHIRALLGKTGVSNRTELSIKARVAGLALHPDTD